METAMPQPDTALPSPACTDQPGGFALDRLPAAEIAAILLAATAIVLRAPDGQALPPGAAAIGSALLHAARHAPVATAAGFLRSLTRAVERCRRDLAAHGYDLLAGCGTMNETGGDTLAVLMPTPTGTGASAPAPDA
jgi:hypothetical protein